MTKTKKQLRAEAVERLKNCVAARFDAESIVIALTSGRHGQSDWSLECDKLIYLLTDDDSTISEDDSTTELLSDEADTREKLEADIWYFIEHNGWFGYEYEAESYADCRKAIFKIFREWLDRQAAITERETTKRHELFCETCEAECDKQIAELTAERDELQAQADEKWNLYVAEHRRADINAADREMYREALSQLLDTLTDGMGKVSALLDSYDEGVA